jgi:hypothetical protein
MGGSGFLVLRRMLTIFQIELSSELNDSSFCSHCLFLKTDSACFTSNWRRFASLRSMGQPVLCAVRLTRFLSQISSTMCCGTVCRFVGSVHRVVAFSTESVILLSKQSTACSKSSSV